MMTKQETHYRERLKLNGVPEHLHDGRVLYLLYHLPPGGFLTAVLSNNLREAIGRADDASAAGLPAIVKFLYNNAPSTCWGSEEYVAEWLALRPTHAS